MRQSKIIIFHENGKMNRFPVFMENQMLFLLNRNITKQVLL